MAASVLKFEYKVMGQTRDEVIDSLDEIVGQVILQEGGEPWVSVEEVYTKTMIDQELALSGDPRGFIWIGVRSVLFTGPTKLAGIEPTFRDGFRPQQDDDSDGYDPDQHFH